MQLTTGKLNHLFDIMSVKLGLFCPHSQLLYHLSVHKFGLTKLLSIPSSTQLTLEALSSKPR